MVWLFPHLYFLNGLKGTDSVWEPFSFFSRLKFKLFLDPFLDLEMWALSEISSTRRIWTWIFVNFVYIYPLKSDLVRFQTIFILWARGTSD